MSKRVICPASRGSGTGDAVFHRGNLELGPAAPSADPQLRPDSLSRLPRDLAAVGFAHGTPLTGQAVEAFSEWLDRVS